MARPSMLKVAEKQRIVLSVLRSECSVAEAARRNRCSETSIAKWRDQFVQGVWPRWRKARGRGRRRVRRSLSASLWS